MGIRFDGHRGYSIAVVLLCVSMFGGLGLSFAEAGAALGAADTYDQNICGAYCTGIDGTQNNGRVETIDTMKFLIALSSVDPRAVAVQEVCYSQFFALGIFLLGRNSAYRNSFHTQRTNVSACQGSNRDFGVGVFGLSYGDPQSDGRAQEDQFDDQSPGDELRGWACLHAGFLSSHYYVCSAHVTPGDYYYRYRQNRQFKGIGDLANPGYWGGDLYVAPGLYIDNVSATIFSDHAEADIVCDNLYRSTYSTTSPTEKKYDYAFRNGPGHCEQDAAVVDVATSDHRLVAGFYTSYP